MSDVKEADKRHIDEFVKANPEFPVVPNLFKTQIDAIHKNLGSNNGNYNSVYQAICDASIDLGSHLDTHIIEFFHTGNSRTVPAPLFEAAKKAREYTARIQKADNPEEKEVPPDLPFTEEREAPSIPLFSKSNIESQDSVGQLLAELFMEHDVRKTEPASTAPEYTQETRPNHPPAPLAVEHTPHDYKDAAPIPVPVKNKKTAQELLIIREENRRKLQAAATKRRKETEANRKAAEKEFDRKRMEAARKAIEERKRLADIKRKENAQIIKRWGKHPADMGLGEIEKKIYAETLSRYRDMCPKGHVPAFAFKAMSRYILDRGWYKSPASLDKKVAQLTKQGKGQVKIASKDSPENFEGIAYKALLMIIKEKETGKSIDFWKYKKRPIPSPVNFQPTAEYQVGEIVLFETATGVVTEKLEENYIKILFDDKVELMYAECKGGR